MDYDLLLLAGVFIVLIAAGFIWKLYDDFQHDTKGLRKLHSRSRARD